MPVIRKKDLVEDAVFSVELESLGYAVLQFRDNCRMDVFCVLKNTDDDWRGLDLNKADILFTIVWRIIDC